MGVNAQKAWAVAAMREPRAEDNEPVDLVFALLVPEESTVEHLEIVAAVAHVFSNDQVRSSIRSAEEPARIHEVLVSNGVFG